MKVGVLGSGDVGQRLASGFAARGHSVMIGTREPASDKLKAWKKSAGAKGSTGSFADAANFGELIVLATSGVGTEPALESAGVGSFAGKVVIDVTNPLDFSRGMPPGLFVGTTDSLGERIQRKIPKAKVVKALNTVSNVQMVDPRMKGGAPMMFIAGDDAAAKKEVESVLKEFGWAGVYDIGGIAGARWLEAAVPLWVALMQQLGTPEHILQPMLPEA